VRGIAGHIEQTERGFGRNSPEEHKHFCPLLPTAMVFVSYGFVLVQVQVGALNAPLNHFSTSPDFLGDTFLVRFLLLA
jgi:hypothetical protein